MERDEREAPARVRPEQQGDGQPENQRDVEDDHVQNPNAAQEKRRAAEEGPGAGENPESGEEV